MKKLIIAFICSLTLAGFAQIPLWKNIFGNMKTIAVCAPGLPGKTSEVDLGIKLLQEAGYKVKVMPNARKNERIRKSVSSELRAADFTKAYLDPEVDAIFCVRGGNGSIAVADRLDWEKLRARKIPVIGFSDITSLHSVMAKNGVGHVFTGPSLTQLTKCNAESVAWFSRALTGSKQPQIKLEIIRGGECSGFPAGGHLTLYQRAFCAGKAPATDGKIIFIECPRSVPKHYIKELEALREKGCFDKCSAVVFGDMKGKKALVDKIILDFAERVKCPVFRGMPYGHQSSNFLIDFERKVTISADGVLSVQ